MHSLTECPRLFGSLHSEIYRFKGIPDIVGKGISIRQPRHSYDQFSYMIVLHESVPSVGRKLLSQPCSVVELAFWEIWDSDMREINMHYSDMRMSTIRHKPTMNFNSDR